MSGVAHFVSGLPKTYRLVPVVSAPRAGSVLIPGAGWSRPIDIAIQLERLRHRLSVPELEAASHCGNGLRSSSGTGYWSAALAGEGSARIGKPAYNRRLSTDGGRGCSSGFVCGAEPSTRGGEDLGLGLGGGVVRPSSRAGDRVGVAQGPLPFAGGAGPLGVSVMPRVAYGTAHGRSRAFAGA